MQNYFPKPSFSDWLVKEILFLNIKSISNGDCRSLLLAKQIDNSLLPYDFITVEFL